MVSESQFVEMDVTEVSVRYIEDGTRQTIRSGEAYVRLQWVENGKARTDGGAVRYDQIKGHRVGDPVRVPMYETRDGLLLPDLSRLETTNGHD